MSNAENGKLQYEAGRNAYAMGALVDSGDQIEFSSAVDLWSGKSGHTPVIRPDGLVTGGIGIPAVSETDDAVDVSALTAYVLGVLKTVAAATDEAITRSAGAFVRINSVTVTSGGAIAVVAGTDGTDTTFVETRNAAGGPPWIPATSVELFQVRTTGSAAAPITAAEIFSTVGSHVERYDYPLWSENPESGSVSFLSALPKIHTGVIPKNVYASYAEPVFADAQLASDFIPAENTHSVSSTQIYGATLGSAASSLGQGSFVAYLTDGITDPLVQLKDETLWFRFYPDRNKAPHALTQGKLGISRTFPSGDNIQAACTISASSPTVEVAA